MNDAGSVFHIPTSLDEAASGLSPVMSGAVGRSRALHSVWLWLRALDLMIDAGEGCSTDLGRMVGTPSRLALTHGHSDHVFGLPGLFAAREFPSLVSGGPLEIIYPVGDPGIEAVQGMILAMWGRTESDKVHWVPVEDGARIPIGKDRFLCAFATEHSPRHPSVGYAVVEQRTRVRSDLRHLRQDELVQLVRSQGRGAIQESYEHTLLVHTGDARRTDHPLMQDADVLIADSTFVASEDRDADTHASAPEVIEVALNRSVKTLVLHHLSLRYDRRTAVEQLRRLCSDLPCTAFLWEERSLIPMK